MGAKPRRQQGRTARQVGVEFSDPNFQLACLQALFDQGALTNERNRALELATGCDEWEINQQRLEFLLGIPLTTKLLAKLTTFCPQGDDDIYFDLLPTWSGEEDSLYIASYQDIVHLTGLRSLTVHAISGQQSLELRHLLRLPALEEVVVSKYLVRSSPEAEESLRSRGVALKIF